MYVALTEKDTRDTMLDKLKKTLFANIDIPIEKVSVAYVIEKRLENSEEYRKEYVSILCLCIAFHELG